MRGKERHGRGRGGERASGGRSVNGEKLGMDRILGVKRITDRSVFSRRNEKAFFPFIQLLQLIIQGDALLLLSTGRRKLKSSPPHPSFCPCFPVSTVLYDMGGGGRNLDFCRLGRPAKFSRNRHPIVRGVRMSKRAKGGGHMIFESSLFPSRGSRRRNCRRRHGSILRSRERRRS